MENENDNSAEVEQEVQEVDRTFRVKPGERILLVVEDVEDDDDEDDEEVDDTEVVDDDDDDDDDDDEENEAELLDTNVASEIPEDVLEAELLRRKEANPSSDR